MHKMQVAACLALLAAFAGVRAANAGALEEGAERYRPYLIEGVASALTGARALRERAAAADLPGAKKAWAVGARRLGALGGVHRRLRA
ncbi:hypothetical protein ACQPTN_10045 [Bradyrhizobium sp. 13971]